MAPKINRKVVQLSNVVEEGRSLPPLPKALMWRACWFATKIAILLGVSGYLYFQAAQGVEWAKGEAMEWYTKGLEYVTVERLVPVPQEPDESTLAQIVAKVSKDAGLDYRLLKVVAAKESSGGRALYRFEPGLYERLLPKYRRQFSDDEIRMLASSHGAFHVLGATALSECGVHWSKLYDPWTSARCAAKYLKKVWDQNGDERDSGKRLWLTFRGYNGQGPQAEAYAHSAMSMLLGELYTEVIKK